MKIVVKNVAENIADITVKYTVRDEISNRSGYYITGIQSASVKEVKGWTAIRSDVTIDREHIVYSNNFQTAAVPIVYYASIGSGYGKQTATVLIEL